MKDDFSLIKFFKDPLFTLIPLFLLLTIPMIISGGSNRESAGDSYGKMEEIRELREMIAYLEIRIQEIRSQIERLTGEIEVLVKRLREAEGSQEIYDEVEELINRILTLKEIIVNKMEELARLEKELESLRASRERNREAMEEVAGKAESIHKELEAREALLKEISDEIDQLVEKLAKDIDEEEKIRQRVEAAKAINRELERQIKEAKNVGSAGGFVEYKVVDKTPVFFEAINRTIVPVDADHYDGTQTPEGAVVIWKKESVSGETVTMLDTRDSKFRSRLIESDPSEEYIVFLVHNDSFDVFRKAREIAYDRGFVVGWEPWAIDYIAFGDGGRDILGGER